MATISAVPAHAHSTAVSQPRLVAAAHEFEAQLMKELLQPMMAGIRLDGEDSDMQNGGVLGEFATEALGRALSNNGGLGIATSIVRSLSRNETASHVGKGIAGSNDLETFGSRELRHCR
jgi:Rod binding domain-containing protein